MAEIPLVYPNHVYQPRRYVIDGHSRTLHREEVSSTPILDGKGQDASPIVEDSLPGSASVSELEMRGRPALVTTCAKIEDPEILCVSFSSSATTADFSSPVLMELDYRQLELQNLVSVRVFVQASALLRLTLLDAQGTFVNVILTDRLAPVVQEKVQVLKTTDYISELAILQAVTGSELHSTMVAFVDSTTVIVALSPFLFTVDLASKSSHVWSETECLENMKARASSFGSFWMHTSNMLLGNLNEGGVMDMSPTAALCISSSSNPLLDETFCVTLHSDASIRRWKIDMNASLLPLEVYPLNSSKLPLPSTWSDARNSVSLCARVYTTNFAIAVHIKTQGFYELSPDSLMDEGRPDVPSDCHLWVYCKGVSDSENLDHECKVLLVPKEAVSLVGMDFNPSVSKSTLSVIFQSVDREHDRIGTMHAVYPHSLISIISPEPDIVGHGSLDKVASRERSRIRSLLVGPSLLESMCDSTLEEVLHEMDSWYLKFLFRPMFPRGTGTVLPPASGCIRRALAKLVHGSSKNKKVGMSIELELTRTMYEWRQREIRTLVIARSPTKSRRISPISEGTPSPIPPGADAGTPFSVYDTFVQQEEVEDEMDLEGTTNEDWEQVEQERSAEVEAHEKRWRRLLLQIWEEEQVSRMPLKVKWLASQPLQVMIRSAVITVTEDRSLVHESMLSEWGTVFDGFALKLLQRIEQDKERSSRLYAIEQQVATTIAKAQLALEPLGSGLVDELTNLARWAWGDDDADGISDDDHERLEETVGGLNPAQLVNWIQATPSNCLGALPGLEIIESLDFQRSQGTTWSQKQVVNYQLRHSACTLSLRCIDSVRRLQLSRSLLLLDMVEGSQARDAALRAYLHSIAILWTSSQRVPMPLTTFQARKPVRLGESSPVSASPPNKRLSYGDDAISILTPLTAIMTTPMDVLAIEISQTMGSDSTIPATPVGIPIFLTRSYFRLAFSSRGDIPIGKPSLLPELGALPPPKDDTIATDYPRLALRLLSPYVAYSLPEDSADVLLARKESLAECLLIESHAVSAGRENAKMRQIACELLVPENASHDNAVDQRMIRTAFDALEVMKQTSSNAPVSKESLAITLQHMVPSGTAIEIRRLCELETVKSLFAPLAICAINDVDDVTRASINLVASIMLHLSRVMYRLTILERHVSIRGTKEDGESPDVLLGFISSAINGMSKTFPDDVCQVMPEYGRMWARLFNHAVHAGQWKTAYSACVRNPMSDHRESSFRRLVRSMVDQGALNDLLLLCIEMGQRISNASSLSSSEANETVDLYDIASEILADAVSKDMYSVRASSPEPTSLSDFQGALYALHVSQKHWRRAAQSMDLRFVNAQRALASGGPYFECNLQSIELRDGLIVEDLALASVAAMNVMELIKDQGHKFLVSGEYGPYNKIPIGELDDELPHSFATSKRTRGLLETVGEEKSIEEIDRLSNFMTRIELEGRAVRSIALRTLFFDRSIDPAVPKSALLRHIDSSKGDIDNLFKNGYYQHGMLLAKAWANNREAETGSSRPEGNDLFYDCLFHLLDSYVVPAALNSSETRTPRPTLEQLHTALDGVGLPDCASYVVPERNCPTANVQYRATSAAAMAFVRKLTLAFTKAENPIAVEVAAMYLDNGAVALPTWLERFLMGADSGCSNGLFAPRPRPGAYIFFGDPAGLLNLYAKRGLLAEACYLVSATLNAVDVDGKTRETKSASRLPEKGEIDFLPYRSIDLLWNLAQLVLDKKALSPSEETKVRAARGSMEKALEKHFALTKISEAGVRSARALQN